MPLSRTDKVGARQQKITNASAEVRNIRLTVEYDGTNYTGWQRQLNGIAVQQVLEEALARHLGHAVRINAADVPIPEYMRLDR